MLYAVNPRISPLPHLISATSLETKKHPPLRISAPYIKKTTTFTGFFIGNRVFQNWSERLPNFWLNSVQARLPIFQAKSGQIGHFRSFSGKRLPIFGPKSVRISKFTVAYKKNCIYINVYI